MWWAVHRRRGRPVGRRREHYGPAARSVADPAPGRGIAVVIVPGISALVDTASQRSGRVAARTRADRRVDRRVGAQGGIAIRAYHVRHLLFYLRSLPGVEAW